MRRACLALAAVALAAPAHAEKPPVVLAPQGDWEILIEDESCIAARLFEGDGEPHLFKLEQFGPSGAVSMSAFGPAFRPFINLQPTELRFREGQKLHKSNPFTAVLPGFDKGIVYGSVTPNWDELAELAAAGTPATKQPVELDVETGRKIAFVGFQQGGRPEVRIATGSMEGVFQSLNGCTSALLEKWGLDAKRLRSALRSPALLNSKKTWGELRKAYRSNAQQGERGVIVLRATISENGTMESCALINTATSGNLAPAICEVIGKAQFAPAIDASGQPFRTLYIQTLKFQTS